MLAVTQPIPSGGLILLYADAARGDADLGNVVLHELGHALGLGHDPAALLMSTNYRGDDQGCVDEGTVKALAALKGLPIDALNWCALPFASSAR
ncbi:Peptidase M66 [Rhodospirillales bacterium URHD0017]|nr:Peptidase M66 [Rhodospirillales bacterium URHD0017]